MTGESPRTVRYGWRLRLGMLLPSSNRVAEPELPSMLPEGVAVHTTRLKLVGSGSDELLAMVERIEEAAQLVSHAGVDIIAFHCTAVSTFDIDMESRIRQRIAAGPTRPPSRPPRPSCRHSAPSMPGASCCSRRTRRR